MSSKRKSNAKAESSDSSLSDLEEPIEVKKPKKSSGSTKSSRTTTSGGEQLIDLTGKKFACVRDFRGKVFVDIREYYEDKSSGELKPGKKGISLNSEQWEYLKSSIGELDDDIRNLRR
ncbi:Activated RNA polymerase II transcriptional coactivator p15 [Schistosoma japonicum]|uniref:Activated RNA polymerase II transcriptional coactivator p15 n=1 Tax=Schistosoma japonicum TaxID=6182 RepID=Q5DEL6_SCHJA|nr:unknown [Schistosoma japonicum]AAX30178.1 SJCHGC01506 protein [Schistosoma japonicum]KAH8851573.1 Activated RNA polymerase II transcriptional coactivator p15 [Schistosoma japonicum]KAH8851574.1 Activated RNA polymerase II transcriptional coactivator p15 [Schistosoma japonicum]KAH8851575.1 Activated RNA polymerase II transcriptional coactivator p15 [Schistosoma japonicum]